jgi:hypothetical protein
LEHVQIHDTGNGRLHEEAGAVHCYVHQTCSDLLPYDSSKRYVCPLYKFVYSFKAVKLFLKHSVYRRIYVNLMFQPCLGRYSPFILRIYEIHKYTVDKIQILSLKTGGTYSYHRALKG